MLARLHAAWILALTALAPPAAAFDAAWHFETTRLGLEHRGFGPDAVRVAQVGNFAVDYFFVVFEELLHKQVRLLENPDAERALLRFPGIGTLVEVGGEEARKTAARMREASVLLHFDNLHGELEGNGRFESLFARLLANTRSMLADLGANPGLPEEERRLLVLAVLGASVHAVQDFYSHTNWIHFDPERYGGSTSGGHLPTFFQACGWSHGRCQAVWDFEVETGIYGEDVGLRTSEGVPKSHEHMAHDNSGLFFAGVSMVQFHDAGPVPASSSAVAHQALAVGTAAEATSEWVDLVEADPAARRALEGARSYRRRSLVLTDPIERIAGGAVRSSCLTEHWDGAQPAAALQRQCDELIDLDPIRLIPAIVRRDVAFFPSPLEKLWGRFLEIDVLSRLAAGLGDESGHYVFAPPAGRSVAETREAP